MLTLNDGRIELWQWDTGRKLTVDADCSQVHFSNKVFGRSIDVDVVGGIAIIPDVLLQTDKELTAWAFVGTAENGYTKISKVFKVNKRNKPADYVFTPADQTTLEEIKEKIDYLESIQDPDAIRDAVDEYLANNPIQVKEKDPTVPNWAKQHTKPKYTAQEVGAVATVNGKTPDENGNVEISIPESGGNVDQTVATLQYYTEENGGGKIANEPNPNSPVWSELPNARLGFGMDKNNAPVPFMVDGQLLVNGTIIARNMADNNQNDFKRNRWGMHVYEGYATDDWARLTMLLDKHIDPETGRKMAEIYYYVQESHNETSYGPVKIGSDVALHSFDFSRDKLVANGEIVGKMPITLARISLTSDIDNTYETIAEADAAYEPENYPVENIRCLKYIALKNAKDGAMFYDTDRNRMVAKINTKWCDIPFEVITDDRYEIFGQSSNEVYCTSVILDKNEITLTDKNIATLTPTILPENTTEVPVWKSSNNHVAMVSNGVITPVANGSAVITVTVGSKSASCNVTVDIEQETGTNLVYAYDTVAETASINTIGVTATKVKATESGYANTAHTEYMRMYAGTNILYGKAFEIDIVSTVYGSPGDKLLTFGSNDHRFAWSGSKWAFYGTKSDGTIGAGDDCTITDPNYFSGKTLRIEIDDGGYVTIYANGEHILTSTVYIPNDEELRIGGYSGGSFNDIVVSAFRIYE